MPEKSDFDKVLGELHDLIEWEDAEAATETAARNFNDIARRLKNK